MQFSNLALFIGLIVFSNINAQVPVIREPHHHPVLINEYVRLLDVHIKPGDTTLFHIHAAPSVMVEITQAKIGLQKISESPSPLVDGLAGNVSYSDYATHPITHRVYNGGKTVFHVMDIELVKKEPSANDGPLLSETGIKTAINEKLVTAYQVTVVSNQTLQINKSSCAYLLICISGKIKANKTITSGEYIFFKPGEEFTIFNQKNEAASIVLLQLK
ncbi:MAG: hypothetical protein JST21_14885 [Bacteroidetes bacterium]|nr:hypothetical protein [Bacteroidota bacterium]